MKIWNQAPLARLIFPFIIGIVLAIHIQMSSGVDIIAFFTMVAAAGLIILLPGIHISYSRSWLAGMLLIAALFAGGYVTTDLKDCSKTNSFFAKHLEKNAVVLARIIAPPSDKGKTIKAEAEVLNVFSATKMVRTSGKAIFYLQKDSIAAKLKYGDELLVKNSFREIEGPHNPGEFDYHNFLRMRNISMQAFLHSGDWRPYGRNSGNSFLAWSFSLREKLLAQLHDCGLNGQEYAVGAALLLGYTDELDPALLSSYAETGSLHVLSVSGMHVAIVCMVFNYLLFFFEKLRYGTFIRAMVLVIMLWFYSALTGLSPSVLRAATMLTFIIIARTFGRNINIYNSLAASAFILLLTNPYLLFDVGFQLSYIAVTGIVYIQPLIAAAWEPGNWFGEQVWTITSVSLAAQIATFPLSLYCFHQFPNYFLIANFIVIPVSTAVIYMGIALFLLHHAGYITLALAAGFKLLLRFLNGSVGIIGSWPGAVISRISISITDAALIYCAIFFFLAYFANRKFILLSCGISCILALLLMQVIQEEQQSKQVRMIVYDIPGFTAIDLITGHEHVLLADSAFAKDLPSQKFHLETAWTGMGLHDMEILRRNHTGRFIRRRGHSLEFSSQKIILVDSSYRIKMNSTSKVEASLLIISCDPELKIADLRKKFVFRKIIFDSSNSRRKVRKWKEECRRYGQDYYSVQDKGALVLDLSEGKYP